MSRWIQEFNQHPFKGIWDTLLEHSAQLDVDDKTVETTVQELSRLKKALNFVNEIIKNADLELTPRSVWTNCQKQADACLQQVNSYASNRNAAHLTQANEHADNLLTYVRPYMVAPAEALEAYGNAVRKYSDQVTNYIESFQKHAKDTQLKLATTVEDATLRADDISNIQDRIKQIDAYFFVGVNGNEPADQYLKGMISDIEEAHTKAETLREELFDGPEAKSMLINGFETKIRQLHETFSKLLTSASTERQELGQFHEKIFGKPSADNDEVIEAGLKKELEDRLQQLGAYEGEQNLRHETLFKKIEALLPGATSAGLASEYKKLRENFSEPISKYTNVFYGSIAALFVGGIFMLLDKISIYPFTIELVKASNWEEMLRTLLARAPFVIPLVWIALFSATRRNQYERLQQEYAHKEALAASYESYKKQLTDLKVDGDVLQKELILRAIEAISYNASKTLDGNHTEKTPAQQVFEKLNADELKKLLDLARGK
jgi:Tfp pilus assembly protein PilO